MPLTKPQREVITCDKRFRVLISGRRFGKTFLAIQEMAKFARFPNQRVWYVSPSYRQSKTICWDMLKEQMIKHKWIKKINESELSITLRNNSQISLKGADNSHRDNLRGVGLNFIVMDEFADIQPQAWYEVLRPTLSDTLGHALFCSSPKGFNFAYDLYSKRDPEWQSFKYTTLEGGQVLQSEIDQAKNDLDERTFQQEYLATFITYAGIIYYNFDRDKNIVETFSNNSTTLHIGLDFNVSPICAVVAVIENDSIYVVDEIQIYSSNTNEMVEEIKNRYKNNHTVIYPDPSARQRKTSAGGQTDLSILINAGFDVKCRNKAPLVRDRVNAVNSKLKNSNGKNSLFVLKSCKNVIKSLERQIYKEGTHVPDKDSGFDHFNDALGYLVEYKYPIRRNFEPNPPSRWS